MVKTALLFPGQGSQYIGMGKTLFDNFKVVKELYEEGCDSLSFDIKKISFEGPLEKLNLTQNTQPAILTHSIAALRVLETESEVLNNLNSFIAAGHSLGEFSALVATKAMSFHDAVKLVSLRGEYMQNACAPGLGTMSAIIGIKSEDVQKICDEVTMPTSVVVCANFNADTQTVISGHVEAVKKTNEKCIEMGAKVVPLAVSAPFHSPLMMPASVKLSERLVDLEMQASKFSYIANVDARIYDAGTEGRVIKENLIKQVFSSVRWLETMNKFNSLNLSGAIELGPGRVLTGLLKKSNRKLPCKNIDTLETVKQFLENKDGV